MPESKNIVFFDGDCGFCARSVRFLFAIDDDEQLSFAPLQGKTAATLLPPSLRHPSQLDSIVLLDRHHRCFTRSAAVIEILTLVGPPWSLARIAYLAPPVIRDKLYDFIAARRRRIPLGNNCPIPSASERKRLLD